MATTEYGSRTQRKGACSADKARAAARLREPEFEITDPKVTGIRYLEHGYPSPLVRWHHHEEFELHYIVATTGRLFVGDYIGPFEPGNLVLTGPRLPHNWISHVEVGESHALRDMVVQFDHDLIARTSEVLPELRELAPLLERARSGVKFLDMDEAARDFMHAIRDASGPTRLGHFCAFMHELASWPSYRLLSSAQIESGADEAVLDKINTVVNFVMAHYGERITLGQAADLVGMNESHFSRFFRRTTGNTFSAFLTQMRISRACELLSSSDEQITSICYAVGYNNVANFNRRFRECKDVTPREYRRLALERFVRGGKAHAPR